MNSLKKLALAASVAVVSAAGAAAADLPVKARALPPAVVGWGGFYVGAAGGYSWSSADRIDLDYFNGYGDVTQKSNGGIIGGTVGYNWQKSHFVYGVEGDLSYLSNRVGQNLTCANCDDPDVNSNKIDGLATVRGRVGVAIDDTLY